MGPDQGKNTLHPSFGRGCAGVDPPISSHHAPDQGWWIQAPSNGKHFDKTLPIYPSDPLPFSPQATERLPSMVSWKLPAPENSITALMKSVRTNKLGPWKRDPGALYSVHPDSSAKNARAGCKLRNPRRARARTAHHAAFVVARAVHYELRLCHVQANTCAGPRFPFDCPKRALGPKPVRVLALSRGLIV